MKVTQTIMSINSRESLSDAKKMSMNIIQSTPVCVSVCTIKDQNRHCEFFEEKKKNNPRKKHFTSPHILRFSLLYQICNRRIDEYLYQKKIKNSHRESISSQLKGKVQNNKKNSFLYISPSNVFEFFSFFCFLSKKFYFYMYSVKIDGILPC